MSSIVSLPSGMSWHIFRKDWRLMWPLAVATAVTQVLVALVIRHAEPFPMPNELSALAALLTFGLAVGMTLLIVLTIQQEAIPSFNQDWLVRPVKRRDLLLGKLLTVVLLIHGPIIVVHLLQGLAEGFPFGSVLYATLLSNFEIALCYSLPVMAIAAMTKSVVEGIVFALATLLGCVLVRLVISEPTADTGLLWIWRSVSHAELLLVTIAVLLWQYFRRGTHQSRALSVGGLLLFTIIPALPWQPAFTIQQWFAENSQVSRAVVVDVDAQSRHGAAGAAALDRQLLAEDSGGKKKGKERANGNVAVVLPLRFSGLPGGRLLHADRSAVRLVRADGTTVYRGLGHVFDLPAAAADGAGTVQQVVEIPAAVYSKVADQPLRLEMDYYATLLRPTTLPPLAALNGAQRLTGFGWCASRMDSKNTAVEVGCRQAGALPFCISMTLQQAGGVLRNPEKFVCELNYEPVPLRFSVDPIDHVEAKLPVRDPAGLGHFPVDATQLQTAQVIIRVYEPEDHFSRQVVVPQLLLRDWRLSDWRAAAEPAAARATPASSD
jgi:hypothetical protein